MLDIAGIGISLPVPLPDSQIIKLWQVTDLPYWPTSGRYSIGSTWTVTSLIRCRVDAIKVSFTAWAIS